MQPLSFYVGIGVPDGLFDRGELGNARFYAKKEAVLTNNLFFYSAISHKRRAEELPDEHA